MPKDSVFWKYYVKKNQREKSILYLGFLQMSLSTIKRRENYLCTWHWDLAKKKPNSPQFFIKLDVNSWFWTFAKVCLRRLIIAIEDLMKHFKNIKCHNMWHIYTTVTHSQFWEGSQSVLLDLCPSLLKAAGQRQWCLVRPSQGPQPLLW